MKTKMNYESPMVTIVEVIVEKGFAASNMNAANTEGLIKGAKGVWDN